MELVENKYGAGAIKSPFDARDHKVSGLGMAQEPFDWDEGYDIEERIKTKIPTEDQNGSGSCGGQAGRYYLGVKQAIQTGTYERLSAKDLYCFIAYPGGGTTTRDIGSQAINHGIAREIVVPSYYNGNPPQEWFIADKKISRGIPDSVRFSELAYARTKLDIDSIAMSIRDNDGIIIMVGGSDNGTWLSTFPKPPEGREQWRHFLYGGKAKLINGVKHIGVKNSWGNDTGDQGWQWLSAKYPIRETLIFYDKNTYSYKPTSGQVVLTWLQRFVQWFKFYQ